MEKEPFIRLGEDGQNAPVLSYSIPESTSYAGTNVITVDIDGDLLNAATRQLIENNLADKLDDDNRPRPNFTGPNGLVFSLNNNPRPSFGLTSPDVRPEPDPRTIDLAAIQEFTVNNPGNFIYRPKESMNGFIGSLGIPPRPRTEGDIRPKILFYERFQISNFLGNYGAGRVIKTFSLFPGERTKISIKTYEKTKSTQNHGSSILDSTTEEAVADFENSVISESSSKHEDYEADILNSESDFNSSSEEGSASASGLGFSISASGKVTSTDETERAGEWGTRSAREEFSKNVSNAIEKHSSRASSKRDIEINTSSETSSEEGQETLIEREIENVNVSRTLNLVFRQMIQEFISVLHLTDVRIALYDESIAPYPQYAIHELDKFLEAYFAEEAWDTIRSEIIRELYYIFNHQDQPTQFLEKAVLEFPDTDTDIDIEMPESIEYFRIRKDQKSKLDEDEHSHIEVDGVILNSNFSAMRTEGVVVDAFLGQGEGLDIYSQGLQTETVRELNLNNALKEQTLSKEQLAANIIAENDGEKAALFSMIYPCCPENKDKQEDTTPALSEDNNDGNG